MPLRDPPEVDGVLQPHVYEYGGFEVMGDCGRCGHVRESPIHIDRETKITDSTKDTHEHIAKVRANLMLVVADLHRRASIHDKTKLEPPEKETFDRVTEKLAAMTYDSPEYRETLREMGPALDHHYEHNDHHPEHWSRGITGMNLMALVEMLADWKAATERHDDGDLASSIEKNVARFEIEPQLAEIIRNTARELGWIA